MMQFFQALSFETPLALWGLLALPVIWWLLRFTPPRPQSIKFPPLRILLGLKQQEETPDKTPWWLLLLRLALAVILILAVAHPKNSEKNLVAQGSGPLLLIVDDGWAAAQNWPKRLDAMQTILQDAQSAGRVVTLATTTLSTRPADLTARSASDALNLLRALQPQALPTDRMGLLKRLNEEKPKLGQVVWLTDSLDAGSAKTFTEGLTQQFGNVVSALQLPNDPPIALGRPAVDGSDIKVTAMQETNTSTISVVQAIAGNGRILAEAPINFAGSNMVSAKLGLPIELRNEIQAITISGQNHAGAKQLLDDRWRRKSIAIQSGAALEEAQPLLSPMHYVTRALEPYGEIQEPANAGELKTTLDAGLSMLIMADIGNLNQANRDTIAPWIEKGGVLLRFAGQHLAATNDELLPVKLREGDRNLGSALSWETPQPIASFAEKGPFAGMAIDPQITISRQVLAEPDADLPDKTWASLADGTPLVTATRKGKGLIILFHVTANADWSNLPLSGTFVDMLQRITDLAPAAGSNTATTTSNDQANAFSMRLLLNGSGELVTPNANIDAIPVKDFDNAKTTAKTPAGIYALGTRERAINLDLKQADLTPITTLSNGITLQNIVPSKTTSYAAILFVLAALLFLADTLAALILGGGLKLPSRSKATAALLTIMMSGAFALHTGDARADDQSDLKAATETHLAFVKTGDAEIDQTSEQGLKGLGLIMADRTSAALGSPMGVNVETDELVFYPVLYWPVSEAAPTPNDKAIARIDSYMKNGGTIVFDTRDAGTDFGNGSPNGDALKRILAKLDVPPLEPVPEGHALTKSFYLLKDWPGRYEGGTLWVEAQNGESPAKSDGVSGIIIGSNDYAAAWALDDSAQPLNAIVGGSDRQREYAFRVGVNIVMYALTGNYKTDQVHVPALLERLGQ